MVLKHQFSRDSAHRRAMFRNLVSSLIEHGRIETTLAKAKDTQRVAEKILTYGRKGTPYAYKEAKAFLFNHDITLPMLFTTLRERYRDRPGACVRLIRNGIRRGDSVPTAILELVDGPGDLKYETSAREVGRLVHVDELDTGRQIVALNAESVARILDQDQNWRLKAKITEALKFRDEQAVREFWAKASAFRDLQRAEPTIYARLAKDKFQRRMATEVAHNRVASGYSESKEQIELSRPSQWLEQVRLEQRLMEEEREAESRLTDGQIRASESPLLEPRHELLGTWAGQILPAQQIVTPHKPVPFFARHDWKRLPASHGGRGGYAVEYEIDPVTGQPDKSRPPKEIGFGAARGETGKVGVEGGWGEGGNGEYELGRSPLALAKGLLGKRRTPVRRFAKDGDGMGG